MKSTFTIILLFLIFSSCNEEKRKYETKKETLLTVMNQKNFKITVEKIRTSNTFVDPKNWAARGLNPSEQSIILKLRKATNDFLDKLEKIYSANEDSEPKYKEVSNIVDELPWDELDTEEKEFLADELAPAIKAAGFDPSTIF
ncbi:hypothetical protein [Frigoriflavimonas asaccharolytica]|uniref:Uncharacterized protein n=1 Tax=Frigoriflavimonas asaccharolytica TaxID=2735899 RepID=A0A8J8G6R4_9FLAO|nr:hypothetical protein [Frigoriflavimonas asaccharolytica]NRS92274.1 hypothetical protein [Frigoriflavimonas asaccharolytica]